MDVEHRPTLPDAHQQIRLGDHQSSAQKWTAAIDCYRRAIEFFKSVQNSFDDKYLISIIDAQIEQCEKTIHLCQLKDRAEQIAKAQQAERSSKITRAHSISSFKDSNKPQRPLTRHNTLRLDNTQTVGGHGGTDSFAAFIFSPKTNRIVPTKAKKHEKHDAEKIEELQMSNEALKAHLNAYAERARQLEKENDRLRNQHRLNPLPDDIHSPISDHQEDESENDELEATL